jgi:DNA-nicking Smr family endonuclease
MHPENLKKPFYPVLGRSHGIIYKMITNKNLNKTGRAGDEIDLHGLTVDEAIPRLEEFIYRAFQAGHYRVWVVHGKGTGILRVEMRRYLAKHPLVRSQRPADPQHGGAGATQVELSD